MNSKLKITIFGGDRRFQLISRLLQGSYEVTDFLCSGAECEFAQAVKSDVIILPLPAVRDGAHINVCDEQLENAGLDISQIPTLFELLLKLTPGQLVLGGMLPGWFIRRCEECGAKAVDYFKDEKLEIMNLIPTVEGCLELLISQSDVTVWGSKIVVTGYGKLGRVLAGQLKNLGAEVTVVARKQSDLANIRLNRLQAADYGSIAAALTGCDFLINTVPAQVIGLFELEAAKSCKLIIDLASKPGGVDKAAAKELELKLIHALSLPGKTAPVSAAGYIYDTISEILRSTEGKNG